MNTCIKKMSIAFESCHFFFKSNDKYTWHKTYYNYFEVHMYISLNIFPPPIFFQWVYISNFKKIKYLGPVVLISALITQHIYATLI